MTTLNLDSQCALAQGWTFHRSVQDRGLWEEVWILPDGSQIPCGQYRPSTDLNQAVDFAEWVSEQTGRGWDLGRPNKKRQHNFVARHALKIAHGNNPAEALCRATLAALGKGREEHV